LINRRTDGLLESWELMRMDLRAELVALSVCESARGRASADEGMIAGKSEEARKTASFLNIRMVLVAGLGF